MPLLAQTTYDFPESGEISITDCDGIIYDNGGINGDYLNNSNSLVLLTAASGSLLSLNFQSFDLENNFDFLTLYSIDDLYGVPIASYTGNNPPAIGEDIVLDANTVYLHFTSDFSVVKEGFAIAFDCFEPTDSPTTDLSASSFTCSGTVSFSDNSSNFPNSWFWDFGDGNTSIEQNPNHTYTATGIYTVSLISCNTVGCDTLLVPAAVEYDPNSSNCTNQFDVPENGSIVVDECSGTIYDPGGADGDYPIGSQGSLIIEIPGATAIEFNFVEFDLSDLIQDFDQVQLYQGENNGGNSTLIGQYFGNTLPNNGATITVEGNTATFLFYADHNDNGGSGFTVQYQAVGQDDAPVAAFESASALVPLGVPVAFSDLSTGNPAFWDWDFGDGATSSLQNPSHTFNTSGSFLVNLTTSNCQGESTATPLNIIVQDAPSLDYTPSDFVFALNSGETTSGIINLSNNGSGDLVANTFTSLSSSNSGFVFEYETDFFASEFSYEVVNAAGETVYTSALADIGGAIYNDTLSGFDWSESLTLNLYDSFGDGALNYFNVYDLATGDLLTSGDFIIGEFMEVPLTGATLAGSNLWIDLAAGIETLSGGTNIDYNFTIDAIELNGGTYETNIVIVSNDPNQPTVFIPITLIVTGEPMATVSTSDIAFGDLLVGETADASFTITNSGTDDLIFDITPLGLNAAFSLTAYTNQLLTPGESNTYEFNFAPNAIGSFGGVVNITTNSSANYVVLVSGNGLAAPSVVATPSSLSAELVAGEDTTLFFNLSNIGAADLDFDILDLSVNQGYSFEFTTDNWAGEFSWQVVNSLGEIVLTSESFFYEGFTTYTEIITDLPSNETYTLQLLDSFGDGALTGFTITDILSGQIIASGDFTGNLSQLDVPLGIPFSDFYTLSVNDGTVSVNGNTDIGITLDATGLNTGTYQLSIPINTNDPANLQVIVPVTLYVIAPVITDFNSSLSFVCGNLAVQFNDASQNVATGWIWDFGDGTTSSEQNPTHLYTADGVYDVSLIACNELGCDTMTYTSFIEVELGCYAQNIPLDGTETITVCSGNIYDSGGATEDYPEGNNGTTIIAPFGATAITLTFTEFNYEEHGDFLSIYEGEGFQGTFIGNFTGTELADTTIVIDGGVVTLIEATNHFVNLSGFAATFSCGTPEPVSPVAGFVVPTISVCDYQGINFNNTTTGATETWSWDFGDGNTSIEASPINFYQTSGTYTITLTACNEFGCDTYSETIDLLIDNDCIISDMPIAGNIVIDDCDGTLFDSGGADADYPNNASGSVTITPFGAASVTLTFVSFNMENNFDELIIYDGPDTSSPVLATLTGEMDVDPITSTGPSITIQEMSDGSVIRSGYEINYNCTINSNRAEFTGELESICSGMMQLYHTSQMESDSWYWDFGDGHTSEEQHPMHQFTETGNHAIRMVACMSADCDTMVNEMWVDALIPEIMAPDTVVLGDTAHFHGMTAEATDWFWEMGDDETSMEAAPSMVFTETGVYEVHVHLSNTNVSDDCSVTHVHSLVVVEPEAVEVTSSIESMPIGLTVYPNPVEDVLYLDWQTNVDITETQIRLFDVQGKTVWSGLWKTTLDVAELPSGIYVLEVARPNEMPFRQRLIIK